MLWIDLFPPKFMCWTVASKVIVFGDRIIKEGIKAKLGHKGGALSDWIINRRRDTRSHSLISHKGERLCEDTVKRQLSASQEESSQEKPTLMVPWSWICGLQFWVKIHVCCFSHSIWDILLLSPYQTKTMSICKEKKKKRERARKQNPTSEITKGKLRGNTGYLEICYHLRRQEVLPWKARLHGLSGLTCCEISGSNLIGLFWNKNPTWKLYAGSLVVTFV